MLDAIGKFLTSPLGTIAQRIATAVVLFGVGYVGWLLKDVQDKQVVNSAEIATVQSVQTSRAIDSERFQAEVRTSIFTTQEQIAAVGEQVEDIAIDAAMTRGILEEMRRQNVASARLPAPDGSVVWLAD